MLPIRTILSPTDFSERSASAFHLASALARDHGSRLLVLHVMSRPTAVYGESMMITEVENDPEPLRQQLRELYAAGGNIPVEHHVVQGAPAAEIVRLAQENHADLIVMGTHGRTGLRRLLLGSVAEKVMRQAPCPVLTVSAPYPETVPYWEAPEEELQHA